MPRVAYKNEALLSGITEARNREKKAKEDIKLKLQEMIQRELEPFHKEVVASVRLAIMDGISARQVGKAYGSSDANTVKSLIEEAMEGSIAVADVTSGWDLLINSDGSFTVEAVGLGEDKFTGVATFTVDEDGENITAISGDFALQAVMYRHGLVSTAVRRVSDTSK